MMNWEDYPPALANTCRYVWEKTRTPIIVTENGWAGHDDVRRGTFVQEALAELHAAIGEGVDIRGYLYWSLLDNYEWAWGYHKRFGIVRVDYDTQERTVKDSGLELARMIRERTL